MSTYAVLATSVCQKHSSCIVDMLNPFVWMVHWSRYADWRACISLLCAQCVRICTISRYTVCISWDIAYWRFPILTVAFSLTTKLPLNIPMRSLPWPVIWYTVLGDGFHRHYRSDHESEARGAGQGRGERCQEVWSDQYYQMEACRLKAIGLKLACRILVCQIEYLGLICMYLRCCWGTKEHWLFLELQVWEIRQVCMVSSWLVHTVSIRASAVGIYSRHPVPDPIRSVRRDTMYLKRGDTGCTVVRGTQRCRAE